MPGNPSFDTLISTTLQNFANKLEDLISTKVAVYNWLKRSGQISTKSGGRSIVEQLLYGLNTTAKNYSMWETLSLDPQGGITAAEFPWAQHAVTVAIAGLEEAENNGEQELIDLLSAKVKQAELTAIEQFDSQFNATTDTTANPKNFYGVGLLINDHLAGAGKTVVGGIDSAAAGNEWWRSYVDRTAGALTLADLSKAYRKASRGPDSPNFAVTTADLWGAYESKLQPQQRFTDPKTAEAGFRNLMSYGAPVVEGSGVTAGTWTYLNSNYIRLNKLGDKWLQQQPFEKKPDVDGRYALILSYGNLTVSNRALGGSRLEARTAA